jgi:hypothetical protein
MSRQALDLYDWDDRSIWGYDPPGGHYYAQLWRNDKPEDPGGRPDIWISSADLATPQALALVISTRTGHSLAAVERAMNLGATAPALEAAIARYAAAPAAVADGKVRILCLSLADGRTEGIPAVGCYLAEYDPEGNSGHGSAAWTPDPGEAMAFESGIAAMECYRAQPRSRPLRADGKPNRPLTMFMIGLH